MHRFNNLKNELNEEILWRYKELKNIHRLYLAHLKNETLKVGSTSISRQLNTRESKYILRSSMPIIYAHWEGFFKIAINLLNKELDSSKPDYNRLNNALLATLTKDKHTAKYKTSDLKFSDMLIDLESNLSWKVVQKFCNIYNLRQANFSKYQIDLGELLKIRNGISHGENSYHFENYESVEKHLKIVLQLMLITKHSVVECLYYEKYYKK
jgi:hypothetical protein